ncbi:MAG: VOC family protein [Oscillospiraceae bacterium]|nr:VOC family protein [Oscillospiraceae bacterium]
MKFCCLLAVKDMERSKAFYKKYLGLGVETDWGANVTLDGGEIALQTLKTWEEFIGGIDVRFKGNAGELAFEKDNFDDFLKNLDELELVHPLVEHSWGQRVVRFYDPDGHIIEVGERMKSVVERFQASGMSIDEIAKRMDVSENDIHKMLQS